MKEDFDLVLDDRDVRLSLSKKKVQLDGIELNVRAVSLGKRRKYTTFQVILFMVAVIACGIVLYAALNTFLVSDDEGSPYMEIDGSNTVSYRRAVGGVSSPVFLTPSGQQAVDLSGSVDWRSEGWDEITIESDTEGRASLLVMWQGNADDLLTRHISVLAVEVDSEDPYKLEIVYFVKLGTDRTVMDQVSFSEFIDNPDTHTGKHRFKVELEEITLGQARNLQSGDVSSNKGCLVGISFPQGISQGEVRVSLSYGPDYYHEPSQMNIILGAVSAVVTLGGLFIVYTRTSRDTAYLILDTKDREYAFSGEHDDLSALYLKISKITIPKMKSAEERDTLRPGVTKGSDIIDEEEADAIGKDLKKRPGGSGKMIVHQCPECMGTELYYEGGFMTGYKYHCKNCDYVGSFVIEKQVDFDK
ncbi:MAG: hypothetical protein ACMUHM_03920 [Thermoplasmatota archaeon]